MKSFLMFPFILGIIICTATPLFAQSSNTSFSTSSPKAAGQHALNIAKDQVKNAAVPVLGENAPNWLKRFEVDAEFKIDKPTDLSVLTVQPLYQSDDAKDTIFTQLSYGRYSLFNDTRNTINTGIGYRRLLGKNDVMLGGNIFFDNDFDYDHRRVSFGAEAKTGPLDGYFNYYQHASGDRSINATTTERVMNGYDFRLTSDVPYAPWAKLHAAYYHWDKVRGANDTNGYEVGSEVALLPNTSFEYKRRDDNNSSSTDSFFLRFRLADQSKPTLVGSLIDGKNPFATTAFQKRDLSNETLTKVRRENRIRVERRVRVIGVGGPGVTFSIVRGN